VFEIELEDIVASSNSSFEQDVEGECLNVCIENGHYIARIFFI
jgi:hypothetical protein